MTHDAADLPIETIGHLRLLSEAGVVRLIVDRIVNPSGHWVLTIASGADEELVQLHSADGPDGPRSPAGDYRIAIIGAAGEPLVEVTGEVVRAWGIVATE